MVLTVDNKKLAYLVAKLRLKTKEFERNIKELLKILHHEQKEYESKDEDPDHKLWELSLLMFHIEGEYYNQKLTKKIKFRNGVMIKVFFPHGESREFLELFDFLFKYLQIENYKIITELVDRKDLLLKTFKDEDFFARYNPIKSFEWNYQDNK